MSAPPRPFLGGRRLGAQLAGVGALDAGGAWRRAGGAPGACLGEEAGPSGRAREAAARAGVGARESAGGGQRRPPRTTSADQPQATPRRGAPRRTDAVGRASAMVVDRTGAPSHPSTSARAYRTNRGPTRENAGPTPNVRQRPNVTGEMPSRPAASALLSHSAPSRGGRAASGRRERGGMTAAPSLNRLLRTFGPPGRASAPLGVDHFRRVTPPPGRETAWRVVFRG